MITLTQTADTSKVFLVNASIGLHRVLDTTSTLSLAGGGLTPPLSHVGRPGHV